MRKNVYIGLDSTGKYCCILKSHLPFDVIKSNMQDLEESDFNHSATNWGGNDELDRTLKLKNITPTGRTAHLPHSLVFEGIDHDMGHAYDWEFAVSRIAETTDRVEHKAAVIGGPRDY